MDASAKRRQPCGARRAGRGHSGWGKRPGECPLLRWTLGAVRQSPLADGLLTLHCIDQILDLDLQGRIPLIGGEWEMMRFHHPQIYDPGIPESLRQKCASNAEPITLSSEESTGESRDGL